MPSLNWIGKEKIVNHNKNVPSKEKLLVEIDRLKKELKRKKKYGLVWDSEREPEEVVEMCREKLPVLKEVEGKEIITDKNKPVNLLIEGDNYHALSVLNYTHKGKIDVIYIDPPYNTGNKDFIYNDRYVDKEDSYRHSKWLSFMEKRLKLAKNLLSEEGIIYISIDDNEIAQLKLIMEDLLNHISTIHWRRTEGQDNLTKNVSVVAEYILVYGREKREKYIFNKFPLSDRAVKEYRYEDEGGKFRRRTLVDKQRGKNKFSVKTPSGDIIEGPFNISEEKFRLIPKEEIYWADGKMPYLKTYLIKDKGSYPNNWFDNSIGTNEDGTDELTKILGRNKFNNPKPVSLIKTLIKMAPKNEYILDFFAGSGTAGHATLELNEEGEGNRRFILCTNNENNNGNGFKIAEDICYPRIKKVIEGYKKNSNGKKVAGLGGNLKYFKTEFVDYKESTDRNKIKLTNEATEMLCVKEGTFEEVKSPAFAKAPAGKNFKIFKNHEHYTGIIFDQLAIKEFKKVISNIKTKFSVYIFSLGDDSFEDEFEDIKQKVKLSPIPEAILKVYRRIFK